LEDEYKNLHGPIDSTEEFKKLESMLFAASTDKERIRINQLIEDLETSYNNEMATVVKTKMQPLYDEIIKLEETITPVRKGFILDFSAGSIVKYDSFKINKSSITNTSVWMTIGYDGFKTDTADNSYFQFWVIKVSN
jgi:hypothetical protein